MKAINKTEKINILSVDNEFSSLLSFKNNISTYKFSYFVNIESAREKNFLTVVVSVLKEKPKTIKSIFSSTDNKEIIKNILLFQSSQKDVKNDNKKLVILKKVTDLTTVMSNDTSVRTTKKIETKRNIDLKNQEKPILQKNAFLANFKTTKSLSLINVDSILKEGVDPSELVSGKHINTILSSMNGVKRLSSNSGNQHLLSSLLGNNQITTNKDLNSESIISIISNDVQKIGELSVVLDINQKDLNSSFSEFYVCFELKNSDNITVQKIIRSVKHSDNIKLLQTPTIPPKVLFSKFDNKTGKNILSIKQIDSNASKIRIYRKKINKNLDLRDSKYELVNSKDFLVNLNGTIQVTDSVNNGSDIVYRVIPIGSQNQVSSEFTNVVVPSTRNPNIEDKINKEIESSRAVALATDNGIKIQIFSVPPGVISLKVLRRDLTNFEKNFTVIEHSSTGQKIMLVNSNFSGIFLDKNVKSNHIYEYSCELTYRNGVARLIKNPDVIKYIPFSDTFSEDTVSINISKPRLITKTDNTFDVVFNIFSFLNDSSFDTLKKLLEKEGLLTYFESELTNEKEFFKKLLAFSVRRIDLKTGESLYFKVLTDTVFSDQNNQNSNNIDYLKPGHSYRYIIYPLLRSPETLFFNNIKSSTSKGGVTTSYLPAKYFHPIIKKTGAIIDDNVLKLNYSESAFEFGILGKYAESEISISENTIKIENSEVFKIGERVVIRWQVFGNKDIIDHFLIIINRMGQEEVVGKAHAIFDGNVIEYMYQIDKDDIGAVKYKITPIFKNYEYGSSILTEEIII